MLPQSHACLRVSSVHPPTTITITIGPTLKVDVVQPEAREYIWSTTTQNFKPLFWCSCNPGLLSPSCLHRIKSNDFEGCIYISTFYTRPKFIKSHIYIGPILTQPIFTQSPFLHADLKKSNPTQNPHPENAIFTWIWIYIKLRKTHFFPLWIFVTRLCQPFTVEK